MSRDLKKEYQEYVEEFNRLKETPEGREEMHKLQMGMRGSYYDKDNPQIIPYNFWVLYTAPVETLRKPMLRNKAQNKDYIESQYGTVWTPNGRVAINPEYVQRNEVTKALRKSLEGYTGSKEAGSDLLFAAKKRADAEGVDFMVAAQKELDQLKGNHIVDTLIEDSYRPDGKAYIDTDDLSNDEWVFCSIPGQINTCKEGGLCRGHKIKEEETFWSWVKGFFK